ncbi:MAG: 30S ribosomal protein S20 [Bacillota bacterium]|nr:30S ribosomal protein S20 [Bacillota bacterium]MDD3298163.1 30S ribosomal protein S20 [Bacillota bacterium]MDD3850357.1 30S ribosomal protein S20 [Bacillota bacterium]MDD4707949.1 30S ribosomal protein S20 [Bacillota bacterium]
MANIKSSEKRARIARVRTARNRSYKSAIKSATKRFDAAVNAGDAEQARAAFIKVEKQLDKAATKGIIHKNTVARKKSRLAKRLNNAM